MEKAWWSYIDNYVDKDERLSFINMGDFAPKFFSRRPGSGAFRSNLNQRIDAWYRHKDSLPRYGCILVREYWRKSSKMNLFFS